MRELVYILLDLKDTLHQKNLVATNMIQIHQALTMLKGHYY